MTNRFPAAARRTLICSALALLGIASGLPAAAAVTAAPTYRFFFDTKHGKDLSETYRLNHDSTGIPLALDQQLVPVSAELMKRIAITLPESKDIRTQSANLIASDDSAVVRLIEPADVWMTFLHEGAGNTNAFGYFTYPEGSPPKSVQDIEHIVILPNASFYNSGGSANGMRTGHRVYLGQFPAGIRIGFFVISNGWDGTKGIKTGNLTFYSLSTLNPETTADLRKHMVLLKDSWGQRVVLGMEDLLRTGGDHDFNDVMFAVESNPVTAIKTDQIVELKYVSGSDHDGDGVPDTLDDYPDDPSMTTRAVYPSASGRAQIAFEDMWPTEGDYDMDDLVLAYTLEEGRAADGSIRELTGSFQIKARGSGYSHGFGINFPKLAPALLESGSLWIDNQPSQPLASEAGQGSLTLMLVDDSIKLAAANPNTRTCYAKKFNAEPNCAEVKGPTIHFRVRFKQALTRDQIGAAPYNPFIYIVGDRGRETHLPEGLPTDKTIKPGVRGTRFGSQADGYVQPAPHYYKTKVLGGKGGLPWAINLPAEWKQPLEKRPINECYPAFVDWVNSGGTTNADWYKTPVAGCVFPTQ
jgi:LruC domain-containing protein